MVMSCVISDTKDCESPVLLTRFLFFGCFDGSSGFLKKQSKKILKGSLGVDMI